MTKPTEQSLLAAVNILTDEVRSLRLILAQEYPKRAEVASEGRRRALRYLGATLAILMLAQFMTITTISYCFLGNNIEIPAACKLIPGYTQAVERGTGQLETFYYLQEQTSSNRAKIAELELEIEKIKQQNKSK